MSCATPNWRAFLQLPVNRHLVHRLPPGVTGHRSEPAGEVSDADVAASPYAEEINKVRPSLAKRYLQRVAAFGNGEITEEKTMNNLELITVIPPLSVREAVRRISWWPLGNQDDGRPLLNGPAMVCARCRVSTGFPEEVATWRLEGGGYPRRTLAPRGSGPHSSSLASKNAGPHGSHSFP